MLECLNRNPYLFKTSRNSFAWNGRDEANILQLMMSWHRAHEDANPTIFNLISYLNILLRPFFSLSFEKEICFRKKCLFLSFASINSMDVAWKMEVNIIPFFSYATATERKIEEKKTHIRSFPQRQTHLLSFLLSNILENLFCVIIDEQPKCA